MGISGIASAGALLLTPTPGDVAQSTPTAGAVAQSPNNESERYASAAYCTRYALVFGSEGMCAHCVLFWRPRVERTTLHYFYYYILQRFIDTNGNQQHRVCGGSINTNP